MMFSLLVRNAIFNGMNTEIWKDVVGCEGRYLISNMGNVTGPYKRNLVTVASRGYLKTCLCAGRKNKQTKAIHRLVAEAFVPRIEGKNHVNHINGVKTDNRVCNLEWCTHTENMRHAIKTGLKKPTVGGLANHRTKLNVAQIIEIRKEWDSLKTPQRRLAESYGVSQGCIWKCLHRKIPYDLEQSL
jgi:hypothetical protein